MWIREYKLLSRFAPEVHSTNRQNTRKLGNSPTNHLKNEYSPHSQFLLCDTSGLQQTKFEIFLRRNFLEINRSVSRNDVSELWETFGTLSAVVSSLSMFVSSLWRKRTLGNFDLNLFLHSGGHCEKFLEHIPTAQMWEVLGRSERRSVCKIIRIIVTEWGQRWNWCRSHNFERL